MKTQTETPKRKERKPEPEPMATRVALHPFLAGMNRTQLALLTDCAMAAHFKTGQTILREGEFANRLYLIETGKVVLESVDSFGEPLMIETIGAGDLLGWSWMFPPYTWHFTARAVEPTTAIVFYGTLLREYCEKDHSLGYELLKRISAVMVKRLQVAHKQMLSLYSHAPSLRPLIGESPFMRPEPDLSGYD
jgi:CRP/FNR family cyclic AMP-dependent transcriptional regulator